MYLTMLHSNINADASITFGQSSSKYEKDLSQSIYYNPMSIGFKGNAQQFNTSTKILNSQNTVRLKTKESYVS